MDEKYKATDDDIPWDANGVKEEFGKLVVNAELSKEVAVQVHFPVIPEEQLTRRQRASLKADREGGLFREDRRVYIKIGKKRQMYWWLCSIESSGFAKLTTGERQFCVVQLEKFKRYTVQGAKWITDKQFQWVKSIAARCLMNGARIETQRENTGSSGTQVPR
jgi:hypothetical protein